MERYSQERIYLSSLTISRKMVDNCLEKENKTLKLVVCGSINSINEGIRFVHIGHGLAFVSDNAEYETSNLQWENERQL